MNLFEPKFWWGIYKRTESNELSEKDLIGTFYSDKERAEKIYVRVYFGNARISKTLPKEMNYKLKKENLVHCYHSIKKDALKISRILDQSGKMNLFENMNYFEVNILKNKKLNLIKLPDATFIKKNYAEEYSKIIRSKTLIEKTKIIPKGLEFKLLLDGEEIGFFSKLNKAENFNKKVLNGNGKIIE